MKNLKRVFLLLTLLVITAVTTVAQNDGQRKDLKRRQAPLEYPAYAAKWMKLELKKAKEIKADTKKSARADRNHARKLGRINQIKASTSALSARKEGNDE